MERLTPPEAGGWLAHLTAVAPGWAVYAAGFVLVLPLLILLQRRTARRRQSCRWRKDQRRNGATMTRWVCTHCHVDAYTKGEAKPKLCKRAYRPTSL